MQDVYTKQTLNMFMLCTEGLSIPYEKKENSLESDLKVSDGLNLQYIRVLSYNECKIKMGVYIVWPY